MLTAGMPLDAAAVPTDHTCDALLEDLQRQQIGIRFADMACAAVCAGLSADQVREAIEAGIRRASL